MNVLLEFSACRAHGELAACDIRVHCTIRTIFFKYKQSIILLTLPHGMVYVPHIAHFVVPFHHCVCIVFIDFEAPALSE